MGYQRFSDKKLELLRRKTGIQWDRAWNHQGPRWLARIREGDECRHAWISHRTYQVGWQTNPSHFDSCETT